MNGAPSLIFGFPRWWNRKRFLDEYRERELDLARSRFPGVGSAPVQPLKEYALAEVEKDPAFGQGRAVVDIKKWKESADSAVKGTSYFVGVEAKLPASEEGKLFSGDWWAYRVVDDRIRLIGGLKDPSRSRSKRAGDPVKFNTIQSFATEPYYMGAFNDERDAHAKSRAGALAESLSPCFISRLLVDRDFESLPPRWLAASG